MSTTCPFPDKHQHASREAAEAAIRSLHRAGRGNPDYQAYLCPCGLHWHIGHSSYALRKRIRRSRGPWSRGRRRVR